MSMPAWKAPSPLKGSSLSPNELVTRPITGQSEGALAESMLPTEPARVPEASAESPKERRVRNMLDSILPERAVVRRAVNSSSERA